jgi:ATP-dependent RNA helicase DeaD
MDSFEELGLASELVEALASEGIERPTPFQESAIPVLCRGNNLVAAAGPGAGILVSYGAALLERVGLEGTGVPAAVVLTPTRDAARRLAESLGRLAAVTGHGVAALGSPWVLPERAHILFATPADLRRRVDANQVELSSVQALVVDGASAMEALGALEHVESLLEALPGDAQRVVVALPMTPVVEDLATRRLRRLVHVPTRPTGQAEASPHRGTLRYRTVDEPKEDDVLALVAELLDEGECRHAALFVRSDDRAADLGDFLTLHGYRAGAPGDGDVPVWLAVVELAALEALESEGTAVGVVSVDVPGGPDAMDRRHGGGRGGHVLVLPREVPHLRDVARRTGYGLTAAPPSIERDRSAGLAETLDLLTEALESEDVAVYLSLLEPLFNEWEPAEVAAAAVALLRKRTPETPPAPQAAADSPTKGNAFVRIYMGLGRRDAAGPGDIVGAITGETGLSGSVVGRIDMRESFSIVEVAAGQADRIIKTLNGTTVKGRSLRVDYDRPDRTGGGQRRAPPRK